MSVSEQNLYPNIVIILADDVGYGDLGPYNPRSGIPTPNIDVLAEQGITFTDAHSPAAVCTPSRYGLLTGRYCWRGVLKRNVLYGYEPSIIEPDRLTLAGFLQKAGYHTACVGKWHLGLGFSARSGEYIDFDRALPWPEADRGMEEKIDFSRPLTNGPVDLGFDYFFGTSGCSTCQPPYGFIENRHFVDIPRIYSDDFLYTGRPGMMTPDWDHSLVDLEFTRQAIDYIESRQHTGQPFFLYLTSNSAHEPCVESVIPSLAGGQSQAGPRGDMVWLFDWMVGQVVDVLERIGQRDNTLLIVTSDNGALPGDRILGEDGREYYRTYHHKSCGDFRGYKSHIWEGGHREPFIASWPKVIPPGTTSSQLVCLTDIFKTCAEVVKREISGSAAEDSSSFAPVLFGDKKDFPNRQCVIHHSGAGVFSVRQGRWKLIHESLGSGGWPPPQGDPPQPGNPGQLYDMVNDPGEERNLYESNPDLVRELTALLGNVRSKSYT
ncbi:MAG: arylsulfatase [bacterium]|nr:arylsulfatase [bacterium]